LDDPDTLDFAQQDPRGFLSHAEANGIIIDEVQRAPMLYSEAFGRCAARGSTVLSACDADRASTIRKDYPIARHVARKSICFIGRS